MTNQKNRIQRVPTNIITGFLGVGKTSAILQLLKNKPSNERWAVLVNEFGEIGVDGSLLQGQYSEQEGVYIHEVPGGCMCCAAGVPMQIALNQLLLRAKPDRLLIEPTGLAHPKEVLKVLSAEHYHDVLSLQKTITLVDARHLADERYTTHDIFNQQIAIADIIVGNKVDLYQKQDKAILKQYVKNHGQANVDVIFAKQGNIEVSQLVGSMSTDSTSHEHQHHNHHATEKPLIVDLPMPECGFIKAVNTGEGFNSVGWRFSPEIIFDHNKLLVLLNKVHAERIKAVFNTEEGVFGYNVTGNERSDDERAKNEVSTGGFTETTLNTIEESRIEIIANTIAESLEAELLACIINKAEITEV